MKYANKSSTTTDLVTGLGRRHKEIAAAINPNTRRVKVKLLSRNAIKAAI
jgi:hypothetical protein